RTDERADAAVPAEIMLRGLRAELVERQLGLAPQDPQARFGGSVPERALAAADRAIAFGDATDLRVQLERHAAAMAGTTVGLLHRAIIRSVPERSPRRGRTRAARARLPSGRQAAPRRAAPTAGRSRRDRGRRGRQPARGSRRRSAAGPAWWRGTRRGLRSARAPSPR